MARVPTRQKPTGCIVVALVLAVSVVVAASSGFV
jgi:hypothetical protein